MQLWLLTVSKKNGKIIHHWKLCCPGVHCHSVHTWSCLQKEPIYVVYHPVSALAQPEFCLLGAWNFCGEFCVQTIWVSEVHCWHDESASPGCVVKLLVPYLSSRRQVKVCSRFCCVKQYSSQPLPNGLLSRCLTSWGVAAVPLPGGYFIKLLWNFFLSNKTNGFSLIRVVFFLETIVTRWIIYGQFTFLTFCRQIRKC